MTVIFAVDDHGRVCGKPVVRKAAGEPVGRVSGVRLIGLLPSTVTAMGVMVASFHVLHDYTLSSLAWLRSLLAIMIGALLSDEPSSLEHEFD